jgi:voltage-gated potassium channel
MLLRRIGWHLRRVRERIDRRTALGLVGLLAGTIVVAALIVTLVEGPITVGKFGESFYWALSLLLGSGDATFVSSGIGRLVSASLIILSVTLLALVTGLLIGFIIDVVIREGQGMGSAGMTGHVVVCGWNPSAREVIDELLADQSHRGVVLLADSERNPADRRVYFIRGDATNEEDLARANIKEASAAIVFPDEPTDAADMRSILVVMAIESIAPGVRTVVEVSNARNGEHLKRAHADEVIATPRLAAHLIARSALYSGLADLVMDLVTGGEGSELYHVQLPSEAAGQTVSQVGELLRRTRTILVAIVRDGKSQVNPPSDFVVQPGDQALVIAESAESLVPVQQPG